MAWVVGGVPHSPPPKDIISISEKFEFKARSSKDDEGNFIMIKLQSTMKMKSWDYLWNDIIKITRAKTAVSNRMNITQMQKMKYK